jgi:hypothetical protein
MSEHFWDSIKNLESANEADVETLLVMPLLEALGHPRTCIASKQKVLFREGRKNQPGRKPEADFVVYAERPFARATSLLVVETKNTSERLDAGREQGESYAQNLRAPILVMTNGRRFEIWQVQVTTESVRMLDCEVSELAARRGEVESLLSREAIKAHCATIEYKRFDVLAHDLGTYERAEYDRLEPLARSAIPRSLLDVATESRTDVIDLLGERRRGAVVLAPSGYGKTTLAAFLVREGMERRWETSCDVLPVSLFLPDLALGSVGLEEFFTARIAIHRPGFSLAAFRDKARDQGLLVVADAFERVVPERRRGIESALRIFLRDYPKVRLFVTSRSQVAPKDLALPVLHLTRYTVDDLQELAASRSASHHGATHAFDRAPEHVYRMAEIPLLADLLLDRYERERRHTTRIVSLYEAWLDRILAASSPVARAPDQALLESIAGETVSGPITMARAIDLVDSRFDPRETLGRLVEADAISVRGTTVELHHEALADFMRARNFWNATPSTRRADLTRVVFEPSSQFAMLLVATAPTAEERDEAWQAVARSDIRLAVRSLRFAAGDETLGTVDPAGARRLLGDIRQTIETQVTSHFDPIAGLLREEIAGVPVEVLGIEGTASSDGVNYSFFEAGGADEPVMLVEPGGLVRRTGCTAMPCSTSGMGWMQVASSVPHAFVKRWTYSSGRGVFAEVGSGRRNGCSDVFAT